MTNKVTITKRKKWISLGETAGILSIESGEDVSEADVLQPALENALELAIYLSKPVVAYTGHPVVVEKVPRQADDAMPRIDESSPHQDLPPTPDWPPWIYPGVRRRELTVVTDSDTTVTVLRNTHWGTVSGLWTLVMRGVVPNAVERKICALRGMPIPLRSDMGPLLTAENGTTADVLDEEDTGFEDYRKGKQVLDLPEEHTIVVRPSALEAYLQTDARKTPEKSLGTREKDNLLTLIAALAKQAGIDPKQRGAPKRLRQALSKLDSGDTLSLRTLQDIAKDLNDR